MPCGYYADSNQDRKMYLGLLFYGMLGSTQG